MIKTVLATLGALMLVALPAAAQERFAGGSFVVSWQPNGTVPTGLGPSDPRGALGGSGVGVGAFGGRFLTPRVGIGVEFSMPSGFDGVQTSARFRSQVSFHDVILSPTVRLRVVKGFEVIGGGSWVLESTTTRSSNRDVVYGTLGPVGPPRTSIHQTFGVVAGADFPIAVGAHVRLAPQLRFHAIHRSPYGSGSGTKALSPVVWRPAIALIITSGAPRP